MWIDVETAPAGLLATVDTVALAPLHTRGVVDDLVRRHRKSKRKRLLNESAAVVSDLVVGLHQESIEIAGNFRVVDLAAREATEITPLLLPLLGIGDVTVRLQSDTQGSEDIRLITRTFTIVIYLVPLVHLEVSFLSFCLILFHRLCLILLINNICFFHLCCWKC